MYCTGLVFLWAVIHKQPHLAQKGSTETSIARKSPLSADKPITLPNIESMEKDLTLETRARQVLLHCVIITHIASNDSPVLVNIIFTL